ncbi:MAG: helix-turn-helix domain-containing protein [Planctomycetes bacterium]|nr:helix-turn-helix domain-containing protein [Planctomycetota bacterium]
MSSPILKPLPVEPIPRVSLRLNEASEALGVSDRTLSTWLKSPHAPPHFRLGGVVLFPIDDLRRWLSEQVAKQE